MRVSVDISFYTCPDCGATYGYPRHYKRDDCPFCLKRERDNLSDLIYEKNEEIDAMYRKESALRGTISRYKNKLKAVRS